VRFVISTDRFHRKISAAPPFDKKTQALHLRFFVFYFVFFAWSSAAVKAAKSAKW
jgi:hypothetical protein